MGPSLVLSVFTCIPPWALSRLPLYSSLELGDWSPVTSTRGTGSGLGAESFQCKPAMSMGGTQARLRLCRHTLPLALRKSLGQSSIPRVLVDRFDVVIEQVPRGEAAGAVLHTEGFSADSPRDWAAARRCLGYPARNALTISWRRGACRTSTGRCEAASRRSKARRGRRRSGWPCWRPVARRARR